MYVLSGSNSVLADYILPLLRDRHQICAFDNDKGDVNNEEFVRKLISDVNAEIFINCYQFDQIDDCEYKRELTYQMNSFSASSIARVCKEKNVLLVHFSTSYVFDGSKSAPYTEDDPANPVSAFGDSKFLSEKMIQESGCRYIIFRMPDVYGRGHYFLQKSFAELKSQGRIQVIKGQRISPTYLYDAALALQGLIEKGLEGLFHFSNQGDVTAAEFFDRAVKKYMALGHFSGDYQVVELEYNDYVRPVETPMYNILDNTKFKNVTGLKVRGWEEALDDFMEKSSMDL